ncbi:nucleotide pyrophosphohydrolase [Thermococcus sp. GR7]|uniref:nucleotide pyrophosphohydrolase n=1 Tax=unclassified Thermococcus TaxID=2627626 RepID=UPI0014314E28|nr:MULTISPECIES: nucleotide pyrophosphohydrolase [unclassified Thermococcus]NJE47163.1 nucleotide pyrophosphohydrolase [Thermococcus sp. GR7]NJE78012.1 nucleotide pyrophosphohydrolase [Thermococcus sp. GR4]NJF22871.1 nucleotide pyrophosphohydrolase [Thermococcus sp. GR5]
MDFGELERKVVAFRDARGWAKYHTPKNLAISAAVELGELLEHFQWGTDEEILELSENPTKREAIADEIEDVVIFLSQALPFERMQ